ncbi:MAG: glycosyltransferase family 39 protein [Thermoplasmata archaeon]|nr:MAG: glycosyltransferase family 39 protein [Thermoplasmata archaeon]
MTLKLKEKLQTRLKNEFEIYALMVVFGVWYLLNIGGAIRGDEAIFTLQGYYFIKGNMSAEQFRPMSRYFFGLGQLMFGRTTFGAKIFVLIFGILTIYLTYHVAKDLSNRLNGFIAALILGMIPLYGDLCVQALMDIMLAFFVMLLFFFLIKYERAQDIIKKQRFLFLVGILSICTLATKLYGVFFSLVVFIILLHGEWKTIKSIQLFKLKNMVKRFKKNLVLLPVFVILGVLFGLLMRAQLSDYWEGAGEKGRADILDLLPGFLDNIVLNMDGSEAYGFFIAIGVVLFFIFWMICALVGRESLRTLKYLATKKGLDRQYHLLIFILGAIIGFIIIYSPYIHNPITLFTQILVNQTIHLKQSSPREVGGVIYDTAPWWSYLYWMYIYLSITFIVGLIVGLCYTAFKFIKKESVDKMYNMLFLYTFIPLALLSSLSLKFFNYFVILFPLFSIYMVIQVTSLVERIGNRLPIGTIKSNTRVLSVSSIAVLMLLPGPLWMTLDDPSLGFDSDYDDVGELIVDYVDEHPDDNIRIVAFDILAVEFYLPDRVLNKVEIIPLLADNFSKDILGRSYTYYSDEVMVSMSQNNEIHMVVDEPSKGKDIESLMRGYVVGNNTAINQINDNLFVYILVE